MDELKHIDTYIRVKRKDAAKVNDNLDKVRGLFSVRLNEVSDKSDYFNSQFVYYAVEPNSKDENAVLDPAFVLKVQNYVDSLYTGRSGEGETEQTEGEDSSYDSDTEVEVSTTTSSSGHHDVSRTASDTLAAEYADYVSAASTTAIPASHTSHSAGYTAKVEFALKLGYTERQVQAALRKLGPNPGQNELLAELIKLGAQTSGIRLGGSESDLGCSALSATDDSISDSIGSQSLSSSLDHPGIASVVAAGSGEHTSELLRFRPVVIDGSNVAMSHGNKEVFSCRGIKICVDWFRARGHKEITVFVPKWRKEASRPDNPITEQDILNELERERLLVFTPSRLVGGKRMICYDDRYILKLAVEVDGIVVSNDNYRDLAQENPEYRRVVEERILMYSFVNDRFMPPDDPLGRTGPTLDNFLRIQPHPPPPCPYGKKCTYGNKCKFHHPERGPLPHKSVTERLVEHAQRQLQARGRDHGPGGNQVKGKSLSLPLQSSSSSSMGASPSSLSAEGDVRKTPLSRTKSSIVTSEGPPLQQGLGLDAATFRSPPPGYPPPPSVYGANPPWVQAAQQPQPTGAVQPRETGGSIHRKLQRQLTLNPVCDPRLYQMQRYMSQQACGTATMASDQGQVHPSVTRIASAPPAHPSHNPQHAAASLMARNISSASDPQLNLSGPPPPPPPHIALAAAWSVPPPQLATSAYQQQPPPLPPSSSTSSAADEARRRLHYHLASIFPEEQVQAVMQLYPNETNPQKICAAILTMFPTSNQPLG